MYLTVHGVYVATLNGSRVGNDVLAPGWTSYPHRLRYQTYDVTDLLRTGDNALEATIRDASGRPVDGADVTVQFFMPAMPTMNMPAMRSEAKLSPAGGGTYRGASGRTMRQHLQGDR